MVKETVRQLGAGNGMVKHGRQVEGTMAGKRAREKRKKNSTKKTGGDNGLCSSDQRGK